jgi:signal transduction histidine kinase
MIEEVKLQSESITQMTATSIAAAVDFNDYIGLNDALEATYINTNIEYLVIHDINNKLYYSRYLNNAKNYNYDSELSKEMSENGRVFLSYSPILVNGKKVGELFIGYSLTKQKLEILKVRQSIIIIGLILILISIIATYLISAYFVQPLSDMSKVFNEISNEDLSKRVKIETEDEIGELAASFNLMLDKLEKANIETKSLNTSLESNNNKLYELNATKDKFFSIIAHDLRNPLGSFREITKLLYDEYSSFEENEKLDLIKMMKDSSNQVFNLLENLLEWSQTQKGKIQFNPTENDLKALIEYSTQLLKLTASKKQISLVNKVPEKISIFADAALLNTILRNLISNAIKFSPMLAKVEIGLSDNPPSGFAQLYVRDSGLGMSKEVLDRLFRIDENIITIGTNGEKGTGLGLILCKEFTEKNGGTIWVESEEGKGSIFYITIPLFYKNY